MLNPNPLIYAELLANIRQISVIAALDTPCDSTTRFELSADRGQIALHHDRRTTVLKLPGLVSPSAQLPNLSLGSKELSCRLPLAGERKRDDPESNESPWPARICGEDTEFSCRMCEASVIKNGTIKAWKDLPSENWAEMMDFWHCHKPSEHEHHRPNEHTGHEHNVTASSRGYGANAKLIAQSTVGFVDLTTFLLTERDCAGIEVKASRDSDQYQALICTTCQQYIGHLDQQAAGYRLYKWRLQSDRSSSTLITHPPNSHRPSMPSIVTAQLQSAILAQCSSKLILLPISQKRASTQSTISANQDPKKPSTFLSLWVLSPSIRYSTTAPEKETDPISNGHTTTAAGKLAMKIFWTTINAATAESMMESNKVEEVFLPPETIVEIEALLRTSASFLPPSGRRFQDWNVGLLERFEEM